VDIVALSRAVSHALRHEPWLYELELDEEGWVPVEELLDTLRKEKPEWSSLQRDDLREMIAQSDKQRHELYDDKIRARYGHSIPGKLQKEQAAPPEWLYHGTSPDAASVVRVDGLRPMARQYVHLSSDVETAHKVGVRKAKVPVILTIRAREAFTHGVNFYRGNDNVWLADEIPPAFIDVN
jgi:putative RNA 2'-phosphotransferase